MSNLVMMENNDAADTTFSSNSSAKKSKMKAFLRYVHYSSYKIGPINDEKLFTTDFFLAIMWLKIDEKKDISCNLQTHVTFRVCVHVRFLF